MKELMNQVQKFLLKYFRGIGTDRAKRCEALTAAGEWALLQQERLRDPSTYQSADEYFSDALCTELLRKCLLPGDTERRRKAAVATFWSCEAQCAATNARLSPFINGGPFGPLDEGVIGFIDLWRKETRRVLGRLPLSLTPRFSGGSTLSDVGSLTTIPDKMSSTPTVYARSYSIARHSIIGTPLDDHDTHLFPRGNRFFTVPKDSEKDRGCCVEASLNVSLQLAVGRELRSRYKDAYGVDLTNAQSLHRELAQKASLGGDVQLVTIDLSNASDTISSQLVKLVLPDAWHSLLNSLRAPVTEIEGKTVYLSKFSSMGNGFTFELETVLFRTLLAALGCKDAYVYGDDMIVETERSSDVLAALKFFGFTPNNKKTFVEGPFRESCGGDFFNGAPVRAHYLKELPDEPQKWIELANGLRRVDPSLKRLGAAWWFCVDQVPKQWRNFGPSTLVGVSVFHDEDAEPTLRRVEGNLVPQYRVMRPVTRSFDLGAYWKPRVAMVAGALGVSSSVVPRGSVIGYKPAYITAWGLATPDVWVVGNYLLT